MGRGRASIFFAIALVVVACFAISAAPAGAVDTIGSDLKSEPNAGVGCLGGSTCTAMNTVLPGAQLTSPIDGVVVRWRIRAETATGECSAPTAPARLKVIRPAGGPFAGVSTSAALPIPSAPATIYTANTQQPIKAGDHIAFDGGDMCFANSQPGPTLARFDPSLADGATATPSLFSSPPGVTPELLINADIEPDVDCDNLGDESQDPKVTLCCPPPRRLKKVKTKSGKKKLRCVKKKRKRKKK